MIALLTRRAAIAGAIASSAALAVAAPRAQTEDASAEQPFDLQRWLNTAEPADVIHWHMTQLAIALHHRSPGLWSFMDDVQNGQVVFVRRDPPAFAGKAKPQETISSLFPQWLAAHAASDAEQDGERQYAEYVRLQCRITALRPSTPKEAAMQLVVETDDGGSDYREAFFRRVRKLAMEG